MPYAGQESQCRICKNDIHWSESMGKWLHYESGKKHNAERGPVITSERQNKDKDKK